MRMYEFKEDDAYRFAQQIGQKVFKRGDELHFDSCPQCHGGKNHDKKTFAINLKSGLCKCQRASCGYQGNMITLARDFDFSLGNETDEYYMPKKRYRKLKTPDVPIVPKEPAVRYLESRGIDAETAKKYEITTQKDHDNILVFPFFDENGQMQFVKYRKTDFDKEKDKNKEWCEANCKPILFGMKQCEDFTMLVVTEGQCFNGDAEIMTPDGWCRLENYKGDKVLQVNEDMSAKFVKPKAYIVKRHQGKMIDVEIGGNYFTSTTDDHNLVFIMNSGKVIKKMAGEKISTAYHIPTAIKFDGGESGWTNDEIALFLAISADGTLDFRKNTYRNKGKTNIYARFGLTKERKVKRLRSILDNLGYEYSDNILGNQCGEYHSICFGVPDKFNSKYLPWWFVTNTTIEQKRFIIDEMVWWDGNHVSNRNQFEYMSIYKHNADVIQAIASTCGYMSTIMTKKSGGNGNFKQGFVYKVSVLLGKNNVSTQQFEKHKKIYDVDKTVYCVTVDSGMILVRQNNRISVSGNCDSLAVASCGIKNAVSVPTGANGFTWVSYCYDWVSQFEEIIIFGDHENGHITLVEDINRRFPNKVKHVREEDYLDCKDANELLMKHGKDAVIKAVENAVPIPVKSVKNLSDVERVDINKVRKLKTGIKELDITLGGGLPFGMVTLVTGKRNTGKSCFASQLMVNAVNQGYTTFAYSGELPNHMYKSWFDFQVAGSNHIIENQDDFGIPQRFIKNQNMTLIENWYHEKAYIYDNSIVESDETEDLLKTIELAIRQNGVEVILIDNLMTAMYLDEEKGSDKYDKQGRFVRKLTRLALNYEVLIILVAHVRKNSFGGDANDEVSGSADITNLAGYVLSYSRGTEQDIEKGIIEESQRFLKLSKNRLTGKLMMGGLKLDYDEKSKRIYAERDGLNRNFIWEDGELSYFNSLDDSDNPFMT